MNKRSLFFLSLILLISAMTFAQDPPVKKINSDSIARDTLPVWRDSIENTLLVDTALKKAPQMPMSRVEKIDSLLKYHSPKKAALRSAIIPGWGQIYNKKYWKVPIVYGALGVAGTIFTYNLTWYKRTRFAYKAKFEVSRPRVDPITGAVFPADSTNYHKIRADLLPIDLNALRSYRDQFRQNIDYSAIFFILMWGLNVVDATVDAHLRPFDVSPDLSLRFKIGPSEMARTNGISLVLAFDDGKRQKRNTNWRGY